MKRYEMECPVCGHLNKDLYLEETDGWMECECCGHLTKQEISTRTVKFSTFCSESVDNVMASVAS